tara:strand:+ start:735 stop:947 length:213 start_codon:yes stop_codon:yes gene_type:complete
MGLIKWLCKKFKCNSSCAYDGNQEFLNNDILNERLSNYQLKIKDLKKIYRILGKRETITLDKQEILNSLV